MKKYFDKEGKIKVEVEYPLKVVSIIELPKTGDAIELKVKIEEQIILRYDTNWGIAP